MKKQKKNKVICPLCQNSYIRKYISEHYKSQHPNSEYSKIIKKGMVYKRFNNNNLIFKTNEDFFCSTCNKLIKKHSKYQHYNSKLHKFLDKKSDEKAIIINHENNVKNNLVNQNKIINYTFPLISENESKDFNSIFSIKYEEPINQLQFNIETKHSDSNNINNKTLENHNKANIDDNNTSDFSIHKININKNIPRNTNNDCDLDLVQTSNKKNQTDSSKDWLESESIKSLGNGGNFDYWKNLPLDKQKQFEEDIKMVIERIEKRKKFNKELLKWRDRERKREKAKFKKKKI